MTGVDDEYAPYDPLTIPGAVPAVDPDDTGEATAPGTPPAFDEKCREPFTGLVHIGALTKTFDFLGHRITVRTLKHAEWLAASLLTAPYAGTMGEPKAYTQAVVSMALVSVDGRDLPMPLGEGTDIGTWARQRFDWVGDNWYSTTVDPVYQAYLELDETVEQVVDAMKKASLQPG